MHAAPAPLAVRLCTTNTTVTTGPARPQETEARFVWVLGRRRQAGCKIKNSSKQQCYLLSTRQLHRASSSAVRGQGQADLPCPHAACDQASSSCGCTNKTLAWTKSTHKQLLAGTTGQAPPHRLHPESGRAGSQGTLRLG